MTKNIYKYETIEFLPINKNKTRYGEGGLRLNSLSKKYGSDLVMSKEQENDLDNFLK